MIHFGKLHGLVGDFNIFFTFYSQRSLIGRPTQQDCFANGKR